MTSASEPSSYDLIIIGAGEAGRAAAHLARTLGGKVAIIDRDLAGPEMHTHLAVYQGETAARIALGEDVRPGRCGDRYPSSPSRATSASRSASRMTT